MKTLWKRFACMAVALITPAMLCSCDEKTPVQGVCYRISGGKNPMIILGSIHVGSPEMEPYGQHILQEIDAADVFVFECDSDSPEVAAQSLAMMQLESGTLQETLSPEIWQLVADACEEARLSPDTLNCFKPWAATSMLTTAAAAKEMGARNSRQAVSQGVEQEVEQHVNGREISYLETAAFQLSLMDGFTPALQDALLRQACEAVLHPKENTSLSQWPIWWRDGNIESFIAEYQQDESLPAELAEEYHQTLVVSRNRNMAKELIRMLEEDESHRFFVTIGLLHLVLPGDSVLFELEEAGYQVERLWMNEK